MRPPDGTKTLRFPERLPPTPPGRKRAEADAENNQPVEETRASNLAILAFYARYEFIFMRIMH
jgi:hypothetical protein